MLCRKTSALAPAFILLLVAGGAPAGLEIDQYLPPSSRI
jgi:hypothetical protein